MSRPTTVHGTVIVDGITPSEMQKRISRRLRDRFRTSGRTTIEIAAEMGVPRTRVSDWLNGNALLGPIHAARIGQVLDCSPAWLLFGVGPPAPWREGFGDTAGTSKARPGRGEDDGGQWVTEFLRREAERSRVERPAAGARPRDAALSGRPTPQGDRR